MARSEAALQRFAGVGSRAAIETAPYRSFDQARSPQVHSNMRMVLPVVELSMVRTMGITPPHRAQFRIGSARSICDGGAESSLS
jgi:hypothetical protein